MEKNNKQIAIIGAGPAGITSAIYIKRASYEPVIYESMVPGGKVNNTAIVENYPGVEKISGPDLAYKFYEHVQQLEVKLVMQNVDKIIRYEDGYLLSCGNEDRFYYAVIIATGTSEKELEVEGAKEFLHKGISYCAICDGPLYRNKKVAVIGGGDAALEEAIYLSSICEKVILIHRRDEFRASAILQEQIKENENIIIMTNYEVVEIKGHSRVEAIVIKNKIDDKKEEIEVNAIFPYIGAIANTTFLSELHIVDEKGYIRVNGRCETALEGLYAAGDVVNKDLRQIVTAVSDGAIAGIEAARYMKEHDF